MSSSKILKVMVLVLSTLLLSAVFANAGSIPQLINYNGVLTDTGGAAVPDGQYDVVFTIYDAPTQGSVLWTETWNATTTKVVTFSGSFNAMLGTYITIPTSFFADHPTAYLGVKVGTDSEMLPRQRITSVGYAFTAGNGIPKGGIIMWSGSVDANGNPLINGVADISWHICDGNNGTPNLKDKFVLGAGGSYPAIGGEKDHILTPAEMPSHTHSQNAHNHGVTDPGHNHLYWYYYNTVGSGNPGGEDSNVAGGRDTSFSATGISINNAMATNNNTGEGAAHNNLPPYYALAFIMKL